MNAVFDAYASYYDLLYRDKDYGGEASYVAGLVRSHAPAAVTLLELGCGTGAHAEHFARAGFAIHGVDFSGKMLAGAEKRKAALPVEVGARMSFGPGDVRSVRLGKRYDAVLSLFHVMSYQTTNADLSAAFATAAAHLAPGGVLLFDFWYGPAVLVQRPGVRVRRLEDEAIRVTRIAEPVLREQENVVYVNYQVLMEDKQTRVLHDLRETHPMRYLFLPEIASQLEAAGLAGIATYEWMTSQEPSIDSWNVCVMARLAG